MAFPVLREQINLLDLLPVETLNEMLDAFASGEMRVTEIARMGGVSVRGWYAWLRVRPEMQKEWQDAAKTAAQVHAHESVHLADDSSPLDSAKTSIRVKARQWLAARMDPEAFGTKPESVADLGGMFMSAMQRINAEDTKRREALKLAPQGEKPMRDSAVLQDGPDVPDFETVERDDSVPLEDLL